jgi:hypothetical protein
MSWESRKGRGRYYYTARRDARGRVVKTYVGTGPAAELAARVVSEAHRRRAAESAALRAEQDGLRPLDALAEMVEVSCRLMTKATLAAAGFPRSALHGGAAMPDLPEPPMPPPPAAGDLRGLIEAVRVGDPQARPRLREALDAHPEVWMYYGDLARHAERAWVEAAGGPDVLLKECLEKRLEALEADLAGPDPTPLERLLAQRSGLCWLQAAYADAVAAQARDVSLKQAEFLQKRQDAAHRRFLAALGALTTVRRLLRGVNGQPTVAEPSRANLPVPSTPAGTVDDPNVEAPAVMIYRMPGATESLSLRNGTDRHCWGHGPSEHRPSFPSAARDGISSREVEPVGQDIDPAKADMQYTGTEAGFAEDHSGDTEARTTRTHRQRTTVRA